jgi:hypothetical protein
MPYVCGKTHVLSELTALFSAKYLIFEDLGSLNPENKDLIQSVAGQFHRFFGGVLRSIAIVAVGGK